jgi:hypothetical protein
MKYASQPKALGICDRCGLTFRLNRLHDQILDKKRTGMRVCQRCLDIDQEQLQVGKTRIDDAFALHNPRPDTSNGREPLIPYNPPFMNNP